MPTAIVPPRIKSKLMVPSQPVAGVEIQAGNAEEAETDCDKQHIKHDAASEPLERRYQEHADA